MDKKIDVSLEGVNFSREQMLELLDDINNAVSDGVQCVRRHDSLPNEVERRFLSVSELELRESEDKPAQITGYAALFDTLSEPLGGGFFSFREKIRPGAFKRTLAEGADVRALVDHDPSKVIGRRKNDTLEVTEDKRGLKVVITPPDTQVGRDIVISIQRGDVDQMSFGFMVREQVWQEFEDPDKTDIRELVDVDLFDVSPVTFPAYTDTTVAVRSMKEWREDNLIRSIGSARRRLALRNSAE